MNKIQIFFIHGGMTFKKKKDYLHFLRTKEISIEEPKRWTDAYLKKMLGNVFEIIKPRMPLQDNAVYDEWKLYFERFFPYLRNNIILIGSSLGGIFLAKYLSENRFPKKILSLYLICAPFDDTLPGEELSGGFKLKSDLSLIERNAKRINLLFAEHDDVVPVAHAKNYAKKLKNANIVIYKHIRSHFIISEFPEIVKMIKADVKTLKKK